MALIGKRNGVGIISGYKFHGFLAWWVWRWYLFNKTSLDTKENKSSNRLDNRFVV